MSSLLLGAVAGVGGCWSAREPTGHEAVGTRHFRSRSEVVPAVDRLLREKSWEALARYYDLRGSGISADRLANGDYFYDRSPEAVPPDEEFRRYRHPFAPGASFDHEMDGGEPDVIVFVMVLDVPPGPNPRERLIYRFRVKRHGWGWQILPRRTGEDAP